MSNQIQRDAEEKMDKAAQFLQQELNGLRTGKANPALVENVTLIITEHQLVCEILLIFQPRNRAK